jgi:hypothetical protein
MRAVGMQALVEAGDRHRRLALAEQLETSNNQAVGRLNSAGARRVQ